MAMVERAWEEGCGAMSCVVGGRVVLWLVGNLVEGGTAGSWWW